MDEKELQLLYNAINAKFDVGDYNTFKTKMSTTEDRKKFYDVVGSKGFDLGDYNKFETRIGGQPNFSAKSLKTDIPSFAQGNQPSSTSVKLNLPQQTQQQFDAATEEKQQRNEVVKQQALTTTATRRLKAKNAPVDDKTLEQEKAAVQNDVTTGKLILSADSKGNKIYARQPGIGESFIKGLSTVERGLNDATAIAYTKATGTPEELAHLYETIAHRKRVESEKEFNLSDELGKMPGLSQVEDSVKPTTDLPTAAPSTAGSLAEMAGGLAPDMLLATGTGGLGTAAKTVAIGGKMYTSSYANKAYELYEKGKQEAMQKGMTEKEASVYSAQEATKNAAEAAIPDAALNTLFFSGKLHSPTANNFISVMKGTAKDALKVGGLGAVASGATSAIEGKQGYNVDDWVDKMLEQGGEFAKMDMLFKVLPILRTLPKAAQSAVKEFAVDPVVKPFVENYIKTLPEVQQVDVVKNLGEYEAATKDLRGVVSEEKMASLGGRMQKRVNRMNDINLVKDEIKQLEEKKANLPEALHEEINSSIEAKNEQIKTLQKEIGSVDKEIETINKSEGTGLEKEVDEATGEPLIPKDEPATIEPVQAATTEPKEQGTESPISESTTATGQGGTEPAAPVLTPKPSRSIAEMTADEINNYAGETKDFYRNQEIEVFGEDGAKKYRAARATSNSSTASDAAVRSADATMKEMEEGLTKEQSDYFFGKDLPDDKYEYDHAELRQIASTVRSIEDAEDKTELSKSLKHPLLDFAKHPKDEGNLAAINAAKRKAKELGIDPSDLIQSAVKNAVKDLSDGNDANFLATKILEKLLKPVEEETKALSSSVHFTDKNGNQVITGQDGLKTVVNKEGKEVSAPTKRKVLAQHLDEMDFTKGDVAPEATEPMQGDKEHFEHVVKNSNNPAELAQVYEANHSDAGLSSVENAIANAGIGKVKRDSFMEFNDKNNINQSLAQSYFDNTGRSIDQVAQEISDQTGVKVEPEDVTNFMVRFPNGGDVLKEKPNRIAIDAAIKFEQLTGFKLKKDIAELARIQKEEVNPSLTPEESKFAEDNISPELANQIIKDEGLTADNIDDFKHLFNGFPYTPEDLAGIKNELHGKGTTEPAAGKQETVSDVGNKEAVNEGKEAEAIEEDKRLGEIQKAGFPMGDWLKKAFTSNRGLPGAWMVLKDLATGRRQLASREMRKAIFDLQDAVKKEKFTDTDQISAALKNTNGQEFLTLPADIQTAVKNMRLMVDGYSESLVNENLVTPAQALNIADHVGEYLNRSYRLYTDKNWSKKVSKETLKDAISFLTQQRLDEIQSDKKHAALTPAEQMKLAKSLGEQDATDLLTKKDTPTGQRYTEQFSKDLTTLKRREEIPEPIRKLLGEYTDPVTQFAVTISKMATLHSQAKLLNDLKETFKGQLFFEKDEVRPEGYNYEVAADGSAAWNPLAGLYTSKNVIEALQEPAANYEKWRAIYLKVLGVIKKFKTVYSGPTQSVNFFANPFISLANGHFSLSHINESWAYYKDAMFKNERTSNEVIETLIKRNVIGQSVNLRQIREMLGKDKASEFALSEFIKPKQSNWNPMKWANKIDNVLQKQYGASDSFWKVYGFMNEATGFADAIYGKKYKDLVGKEKEEIDSIASERIKNGYPTYDRALPALMAVGKNVPFIGNFMAFQAEVLRTTKNNILYAKEDLKSSNPKIKMMGAKRLAGIVSYIGLKQGINYAAVMATGNAVSSLWAASFGSKDDKDKRQALDKFAPDFLQTHNLRVETDGKGKYTVYDIDRLDPYNAGWQSLNGLAVGKDGGIKKAIKELAGPFVEPDMIIKSIFDINKNEDFAGKPIYNKADTESDQFKSKMAYIYKVIEPTTLKLFKRAKDADDPVKEVSASMFGARSYEINIGLGFKARVHSTEDKLSDNSYFNFKDKTGEEKAKIQANFKRAILELKDYHDSAVKLGTPVSEIDEIIKKSFQRIGGAKNIKKMITTGVIDEKVVEEIYKEKPKKK